ncbi:MAG: hypothetical protein JXM73_13835 [Anaerolineae bacterium]|nr:hypothetical protein [Anaerolineae bacterium]
MSRIFKIGTTKIVEDDSMAGLTVEQVRDRLKTTYPELAEATVREKTEGDVTYVEWLARPGRKG